MSSLSCFPMYCYKFAGMPIRWLVQPLEINDPKCEHNSWMRCVLIHLPCHCSDMSTVFLQPGLLHADPNSFCGWAYVNFLQMLQQYVQFPMEGRLGVQTGNYRTSKCKEFLSRPPIHQPSADLRVPWRSIVSGTQSRFWYTTRRIVGFCQSTDGLS